MWGRGKGGEEGDGSGGRGGGGVVVVVEAGVAEVDPGIEWRGRGRRLVGQGSEKREEILVDVDAQRAHGEHVAAQMELAVLTRGQEEGAVDVRLHDEVAKL